MRSHTLQTTAAVERYGEWFASQIRLFQKTLPNAAIVVIGPSDMATKEEQHMVTYPMLVPVRNALRRAALNEDVLYWDVFEVMGGAGSMAAWVASCALLLLALTMSTSRVGAPRKIASLLLQSLDAEWRAWEHWHSENTPASVRCHEPLDMPIRSLRTDRGIRNGPGIPLPSDSIPLPPSSPTWRLPAVSLHPD